MYIIRKVGALHHIKVRSYICNSSGDEPHDTRKKNVNKMTMYKAEQHNECNASITHRALRMLCRRRILKQTALMKERDWGRRAGFRDNGIAKSDLFSDYFVLYLSDVCAQRMEFLDAVADYSFTILLTLPFHSVLVIPFHALLFVEATSSFVCATVFSIKYAQYFAALRFNKIQQYLTDCESYFGFWLN